MMGRRGRECGGEEEESLSRLTYAQQVVRNHINDNAHTFNTGSRAYYSTGMWTILAAAILLFLGMFIVLFTRFDSRRSRKVEHVVVHKNVDESYPAGNGVGYNEYGALPMAPRRKRFGLF